MQWRSDLGMTEGLLICRTVRRRTTFAPRYGHGKYPLDGYAVLSCGVARIVTSRWYFAQMSERLIQTELGHLASRTARSWAIIGCPS